MLPTLTVPPHSVTNAHGTPLIDDNVTDLCYYSMYNKCYNDSDPLIHGIITSICDIIIYKRGYPERSVHIGIQRDTHKNGRF